MVISLRDLVMELLLGLVWALMRGPIRVVVATLVVA